MLNRCIFVSTLINKVNLKALAILLILGSGTFAQETSVTTRASGFEIYDKSHISPDYRKKHAISIGGQNSFSTPLDGISQYDSLKNKDIIDWNPGFHIGYDFLILRRRVRLVSEHAKPATEIKNGWGIHFAFHQNKEFLLNTVYHRPIFKLYIPLFRFYLFNDFGLGVHYNPRFEGTSTKPVSLVLTSEVLRIRWCNSPVYLYINGAYSIRNNVLGTQTLGVSVMGGLKVYFYKYE